MTVLNNFKAMPVALKFITIHGLACVVLLPMYALVLAGDSPPQDSMSISGRLGWLIGAAGVVMPTSALLHLLRRGVGRYLYLFCFGAALALPPLARGQYLAAFVGFVIVMLLTSYLFFSQAIETYFAARL